MKTQLEALLGQAVLALKAEGKLPVDLEPNILLERTRDEAHGDYACNIALTLAKAAAMPPRQLALAIVSALPKDAILQKVEIAGPGFINFFLSKAERLSVLAKIREQGVNFGRSQLGKGKKLLLEYVSANPTGPLHVGHGRGAAFGASLANLLTAVGYEVSREYYVNDAGRQMNILAASVWMRYLALLGEPISFPANAYHGDYVREIAEQILVQVQGRYRHSWESISHGLPADEAQGGDKEQYIDALIKAAQNCLGTDGFAYFHQAGMQSVLADIKEDLEAFGVPFDNWFSEQSLADSKAIDSAIEALKQAGKTYEQNGALWFKAMEYGDEKDRVLVRANGQHTYFASDVAYHWNKYQRGFDRVINVFGADHHGYVTRIRAAVRALGHDDSALDILLVQFAILYRGETRVQMSTRSGSFVTLRELREEVGNDAARFFYVLRKPEQHMDFDLELAKSQSSDNPVYYIQCAHARICSVLRQLNERGFALATAEADASLLVEPLEDSLLSLLNRYPEVLEQAGHDCEPHQLAYYLRELANGLHSYYNAVTLLCESEPLRQARLSLLLALRQVLQNGLAILGVFAPESM